MSDVAATLVVCDAGPLIHLDELDCLDLLNDFSRIVVPDAVWREIEYHRPTALTQTKVHFERLKPSNELSAELTQAYGRLPHGVLTFNFLSHVSRRSVIG